MKKWKKFLPWWGIELTTPSLWGWRSTNWATEEIFMEEEILVKMVYNFAIITNTVGAWPNLSSSQAIRANLVYIVSLILSNARLDSSKLDEKGHIVVKSPTGIAGRNQLNSEFLLVFSPVRFCPVLTCPISYWTAGIFVCFCFIPNNSVQC